MLGEHLRQAREAAGRSQQEVAAAAGISREYLSEVERDNKSPTVRTLLKICEAIGCSAGELLLRTQPATPAPTPKRKQ